jgi:hypothetical protein
MARRAGRKLVGFISVLPGFQLSGKRVDRVLPETRMGIRFRIADQPSNNVAPKA